MNITTSASSGEATSQGFAEFPYSRPDIDQLESDFAATLGRFSEAPTYPAAEQAFQDIYALRSHFMTMYNLAHIRHTMDTRDAFYEAENNYFDEQLPRFEALKTDFHRALLASRHRPQLTTRWGDQLFRIAELSLRTFRPEILGDLQEENRLASEYTKLKAKALIAYNGQTYNLSSIQVAELDPDRTLRRGAAEAKWAWFAEHAPQFERIFDELVRVRTHIARQLGFDNYVGLGYARMLRTDYQADDVARFREQIARHIVPLANEVYARQRQRLGLDSLHYFDEDFRYPEGNPQPQGPPAWIIDQASRMYDELSDETSAFFRFMRAGGLMDLEARDGKATGGYCTFIDGHRTPFIFSNFTGGSADIDVLTHEAGHAFQVFSSRHIGIEEYHWPTYEACEIHSMSMEFFTWPWMQLFFGDQAPRYQAGHLSGAITFLPYGVAVDEFQHLVYANPHLSPAERNQAWRQLERRYLPHRSYAGNDFLENGGFWQKQTHIFGMPFYYIDYTLAQVCAFQFWLRNQQDHAGAWADYLRLCQAGGSRSFLQLVELANLQSPFREGGVAEVAAAAAQWLRQHPQA